MLVNILYLQHDDVYTQHVKHIETHNHCTEVDLQQKNSFILPEQIIKCKQVM